MILLIDNYDSFVYNLAQAFMELDQDVLVKRNDRITLDEAKHISPYALVVSPGPKTPDQAGSSKNFIQYFSGRIPILGVCLGHQCIAYSFGGKIRRAEKIVHGKLSRIYHNQAELYSGVKNPFFATRYHSLLVDEETLPSHIEITAFTRDGEVMGIKIKGQNTVGVQFHPESFLSEEGKKILCNFIKLGGRR